MNPTTQKQTLLYLDASINRTTRFVASQKSFEVSKGVTLMKAITDDCGNVS